LHSAEAWKTHALRYQYEMKFNDRSSGMREHVIWTVHVPEH